MFWLAVRVIRSNTQIDRAIASRVVASLFPAMMIGKRFSGTFSRHPTGGERWRTELRFLKDEPREPDQT